MCNFKKLTSLIVPTPNNQVAVYEMDSPWSSMADSMVGDFGFSDRYGPNESVYEMLNRTRPEFLTCVPDHWQQQPKPTLFVRATISVVFSLLSIPGNASQILVLVAFLR